MGKRARNNNPSGKGKKFAKQSADARGSSAEELLRRRVQTQRTRLQRALDKAKDDLELQAKLHIDGATSHADAAANGDELAIKCRLEHLNKLHKLVSFAPSGASSSSSEKGNAAAAKTTNFSEATITSTANLQPALVLALLDEGALADATEALDQWVPRDGSNAATFSTSRAATPLLFSRALCDFVAWRGAPGEDAPPEDRTDSTGANEGSETSPLEEAANLSFDRALEANVYVGVLLANLSIFLREIDPAVAAEAANVTPVVPDDDVITFDAGSSATSGSSSKSSNSKSTGDKANSSKSSNEGSDAARGKFAGSVEEALAYAAGAGSCWMDLLEKGCEEWASSRLANFAFEGDADADDDDDDDDGNEEGRASKEAEMGCVEWPPRRCSKAGARFVQLFVAAAETAEEEASEGEEDGDAEDKDELLSAISEGDEAAASDYEGR